MVSQDNNAVSITPTIVYIHGIGNQPTGECLKKRWDRVIFGDDPKGSSRMAYWSDIFYDEPGRCEKGDVSLAALIQLEQSAVLSHEAGPYAGVLDGSSAQTAALAIGMNEQFLASYTPEGFGFEPQSLGATVRLASRFSWEAAAYFVDRGKRAKMQERLQKALDAVADPIVLIAHSLGSVIAYDVLSEQRYSKRQIRLFITIGSPLGIPVIQCFLTRPLRAHRSISAWYSFSDRWDPVALDQTLSDRFQPAGTIFDGRVMNPDRPLRHAAVGYLASHLVRRIIRAEFPH
jgi:hypothetical protein